MIQAIDSEQLFVTNLEQFMSKAEKFLKIYNSGISEKNHVIEIMQELKNMLLDTDLQQLEIDYQHHCGIKDLITDYDDSAWF